ncbi:MAG: leucine-rich repeat protein [Prevotella sp.]|nr:leucine-rich repeat protein [Prevotella sp.]
MIKKLLFTISLFAAALPFTANGQTVTIDGASYTLNSSGNAAELTSGKSCTGYVNIPSVVTSDGTEYTVTSIGYQAFTSSKVTSVVVPETVKSIDDMAFARCTKLTALYLLTPNAYIGSRVLYNSMAAKVYTVEGHSYANSFDRNTTIITGSYAFDEDGNIMMRQALNEFKDDTPYTNSTTYMADKATYTRGGVKAGYWCSLCLPFDCDVPAGVTIEAFKEVSGSSACFVKVSKIKAGQGYIFKSDTDGDVTFSAENAVLKPFSEIEDTDMTGTFVGVLHKGLVLTDLGFRDKKVYGINPADNEFQLMNEMRDGNPDEILCPPFHAFLQIDINSSDSKMNIIHYDGDETTAIRNGIAVGSTERTAAYTIGGQRTATPRKGINIINGKKVIIK